MSKLITIDDLPDTIFGAEENENDNPGTESEGEPQDTDTQDTDSNSDDKPTEDSGLKKALDAERTARKALEKRLKAMDRADADKKLAEKSELEQAQTRLDAATQKTTRLAEGFARREVDSVIRQAAASLNFIDPSDAVQGVDRKSITFNQDEDDPSQVEVDEAQVKKLVKELAAKKSHFIRTGTSDGEPTGGKFGGSRRTKTPTSDEVLKAKYTALQ